MRAGASIRTSVLKMNKPIRAARKPKLLACIICFFWLYSCAAIFMFCSNFGFYANREVVVEPEILIHPNVSSQNDEPVTLTVNKFTTSEPFHTYDKTIHFFQNEIVGVLLVENDFDLDDFVSSEINPDCEKSGDLCAPRSGGKCTWCSTEFPKCILGTFHFNRKFENQALTKNELYMYQNLQYEYNSREDIRIRMHHYTMFHEIMFSCKFVPKLGVGIRGNLSIPWMDNKRKATKLASDDLIPPPPLKRSVRPNSSCLVCGRGLYGKVAAENIIKHVEYYEYQGLGTVIMYDIGMSYVTNRYLLGKYVESGALTLVDLREFVQFSFGYKSTFSLLRSIAVGQMWLKYDCLLRARRMGYEWVLHLDMDEYLFMGVNSLQAHKRKYNNLNDYFKTVRSNINWLSFGSLKNKKDVELCHVAMKNQKNGSSYDWNTLSDHMNKLHFEHESPNGQLYFVYNFTGRSHLACHDYHVCPGASGLRKIASRTNIRPLDLHIHTVSFHDNGHRKRLRYSPFTDQDISVDEMYIRHYGCLNYILPRFTNKQRPHKKLSTA